MIGGSDGSRLGSGVFEDTNVVSLYVAAFDSNGIRIPDSSATGRADLTRSNDPAVAGDDRWEGRMSLDLSEVGQITLHTVGESSTGMKTGSCRHRTN